MYLRPIFTETDREAQLDVIRDSGWGYIVGTHDDIPIASHLAFMVEGEPGCEKLAGHMARANPHWRTFADGKQVLVIFQGPHTYVTPSLCKAERALPTWNYVAVHVYGRPVVVDDPETVWTAQKRLVDFHESRFDVPWRMESLDKDWVNSMLRSTVRFDIPIERMEATFRLMQNRPADDRQRVADALAAYDDTNAQHVAELMRRYSLTSAK